LQQEFRVDHNESLTKTAKLVETLVDLLLRSSFLK
jgi:hypothetical protein